MTKREPGSNQTVPYQHNHQRRDLHYDRACLPVTVSTLRPCEVAQSRRKLFMKMKRRILLALLGLLVGWGGVGMAQAAPTVTFDAQDAPGTWFKCSNTDSTKSIGCVPESVAGTGQQSLAVIQPGESVGFTSTGQANTIH